MRLVTLFRNYQPLVFSLGLRGIFAGATLLITILLSRLLGSDGFGVYATVLSLTLLIAGLAQAGSAQLLVREVPIIGDTGAALRLTVSILGLILALAGLLYIIMSVVDPKTASYAPLHIALIVFMTVILTASSAAIRGFKHVLAGQMADTLIRPLALLGVLAVFWWTSQPFGFGQALWFYSAALAGALAVNCVILFKIMMSARKRSTAVQPMTTGQAAKALLGLSLLGWFAAINTQLPPYLSGTLAGPEQAGLFKVAMQFAALLTMGLSAVEFAQGPHYSLAYKAGDRLAMHQLLQRSCRFGTVIAVPSGLVLFFAAGWIVDLLFGNEFASAATAVQILALGTMANALTGNIGILLIACNAERVLAFSSGLAIAVLVACCFLLIPQYGATGAAIGFASGLVTRNLINAIIAVRRTGIIAFPFAPPPTR